MTDEMSSDRGFILIPSSSGGGALVRRSQIAGSRSNGQDGAIVYLASGPSVYSAHQTNFFDIRLFHGNAHTYLLKIAGEGAGA